MPRENNFLLGNGERLAYIETPVTVGGKKTPPYDFQTAKNQVHKWLQNTTNSFNKLSQNACPGDEVVATLTMHPRYISKSDFPIELLNEVGLRTVGGHSKIVKPRAWGVNKHPEDAPTDEFYVSGKRASFRDWMSHISQWDIKHPGAEHLMHIEFLNPFMGADKVRAIPNGDETILLEVVIHDTGNIKIIDYFTSYVAELGGNPVLEKFRRVNGLIFAPVYANISYVEELADFSLVRVVRPMPKLRKLRPSISKSTAGLEVILHKQEPVDSNIRVAIFDGGIPDDSMLKPLVRVVNVSNIGKPDREHLEHGVAVTSAFLFGPLKSTDKDLPVPLCTVDHIRVLDELTENKDDFFYYEVLDRIIEILDKPDFDYEFINGYS